MTVPSSLPLCPSAKLLQRSCALHHPNKANYLFQYRQQIFQNHLKTSNLLPADSPIQPTLQYSLLSSTVYSPIQAKYLPTLSLRDKQSSSSLLPNPQDRLHHSAYLERLPQTPSVTGQLGSCLILK